MFDLEKEISEWLKLLRRNPAFEEGDVQEIEEHIREEIAEEHATGTSLEKAFSNSIKAFGALDEIGEEMIKARTKNFKLRFKYKLEPIFPKSKRPQFYTVALFHNYFKTSVRILLRNKLYSLLNISSLSLGLFPCILLLLYLQYEYSFDTFHRDSERIYRIAFDGHRVSGPYKTINTSPILNEAIQNEFPGSAEILRLYHNQGPITMQSGDKLFNESNYLYADKNLFDFFDIELEQGNPETALEKPHSMVITREFAQKYFGNEDPIGKLIRLDVWINFASTKPFTFEPNPSGLDPAGEYIVTGIVKKMPSNSHIQMDCLLSLSSIYWWDMWNKTLFEYNQTATYVKLPPEASGSGFEDKLNSIVDKYHAAAIEISLEVDYGKFLAEGNKLKYSLIPLSRLRFDGEGLSRSFEKLGTFNYIYYLTVIAVISVLIGCINFINLSTARSSDRSKEIGIRKVTGSVKSQLINQFLLESIVLSMFSLILATIITAIIIPYFNAFLESNISISAILYTWVLPVMLGVVLIVGIIAGIYPAYILSSFRPALIIKGNYLRPSGSKGTVRNVLVLFQYGTSILFIMGAIIVSYQLKYLSRKDLGFDKDQVLVMHGAPPPHLNFLVKPSNRYLELKKEVANIKGVKGVSGFTEIFGSRTLIHCYLRSMDNPAEEGDTYHQLGIGDKDIVKNFQIKVVSDTVLDLPGKSYYLTEAAVKSLKISDPVGQHLIRSWWRYSGTDWKYDLDTMMVAGVIEDFHYNSALSEIEPVGLIVMDPEIMTNPLHKVYVKLTGGAIHETVDEIESKWKAIVPEYPFVYSFLDTDIENWYLKEQRLSNLISFFTILSIFISCLGILGLSAFLGQQKNKEISIRKIFGASFIHVVSILSRSHVKVILGALLIFMPTAYLLGTKWLSQYPYRISIDSGVVLLTIAAIVSMTTISISWQLIKCIYSNPLKTIRTE